VEANQWRFEKTKVTTSCIVWNNDADLRTYKEKFDFVLCADCLYFRDCHLALLRCMSLILKDKGQVIIFAPQRGGTLSQFTEQSKEAFHVEITERYDDAVWDCHQQALRNSPSLYKPDIHYPIQLRLKKLVRENRK
jgi:calmodulin-lysine N-methyltransferase